MTDTKNWIEVDRAGLADLIRNQPKRRIIFELVQNAWDEDGVTSVHVTVKSNGHGTHEVSVTDDSADGYTDIRHAWVLYAPSKKKADPTRRGRFNSGCKMVLALAKSAMVVSTQSAVEFTEEEGRRNLRRRRKAGTEFAGTFKMTKAEAREACTQALRLIPPDGITTTITFQGDARFEPFSKIIEPRKPMRVTDAVSLPTIAADDEGVLRQRDRVTVINLHEPKEGEPPMLYELGIPVLELTGGEPWHMDVQQRIPLNQDRDNTTPRYLQKVRCATISAAYEDLTPESANAVWATNANEDFTCKREATSKLLDLRFGERRVSYDPSDEEANKIAVAQGYTVVHGGSLTSHQWINATHDHCIKPAGQVTPSPKILTSPDGVASIHVNHWTTTMRDMANYAVKLCSILCVKEDLTVRWYAEPRLGFEGYWGGGILGLNKGRLDSIIAGWEDGDPREFVALLIHEFAHEKFADHLCSEFADEIAALGARLFWIATGSLSEQLPTL